MSNEYVTQAELKATLDLRDTTWDADVRAALTAASRAIDNECGRRFWKDTAATNVRYYQPRSTESFEIDDLVTLSNLKVDGALDGTFTTTWAVDTNFTFEPLNAPADNQPWTRVTIRRQAALYLPTEYGRTVKITGQFGWPAVPDAIVEATTILAARLFKRAREAAFGVASIGLEGAPMRIARVDPDVAALVAPYRRGSVLV